MHLPLKLPGDTPVRESTIERNLAEQVKALGDKIQKIKWIGQSTALNRSVMPPTCTVVAEIQTLGKKCHQPHQLREHERMRCMGQRVEVVDSFADVGNILV